MFGFINNKDNDNEEFNVAKDLKKRKIRLAIIYGVLAFIIFNLIMYYLTKL
jgi:hypothetical protein